MLACLQHAREHWAQRRDFIPLPPVAEGMVARRHFEAMVFAYLAGELRTGDIAVTGAGEYADWRAGA